MVMYRGVCAAVLVGLVAFIGLMGTAQAQGVDPYEQYYGPRPTPYSSTYSQPYQQPTYQQPQNPQPTYQAPQQYGQQPYYGGYQQPTYQHPHAQYGRQPVESVDPYERSAQRLPPNSQTGQTIEQPPLAEFALAVGAGLSGTYFADEPSYTTELGGNLFASAQWRFNLDQTALLIGVEAGFQYLGELEIDYGYFTESYTTYSYGFSLRPGVSFGGKFDIYGRVGVHYWDLTGHSPWGSWSTQDYDLLYGAGMEFNLSEKVGVRLDWTEFEIREEDGFGAVTGAVYYRIF